MSRAILLIAALIGLMPSGVIAQDFAAAGARARGMGGAFVGVADDASAIYWNPAGLAAGSFFSLVMDSGNGETVPRSAPAGAEQSSFLLGLSMPALGLGYYRLRQNMATVTLSFEGIPGETRLDSLLTHHAGITLVQSIGPGISVGTTLKLVRGIAASLVQPGIDPRTLLQADDAELLGRATNRFDADIGLMAAGGPLKIGLTLRNVTEPEFTAAGSGAPELTLQRQARAGLSYALTRDWLAAADLDLLETEDVFGDRREVAFGLEGRAASRLWVRSGVRFNIAADDRFDDRHAAGLSVGGSYAARAAVFIDGYFNGGDGRAGREWGFGARFLY